MRIGKEGLPLETSTLFTEIRTKYNTFSAAQKIIANYVLENSEKVILLTISDLAAACNTSETTILRFLHKLGYNSYQVFRVKMAQDVGMSSNDQLSHTVYEEIITGDDIASIKRKVILSTIASIQDLSSSSQTRVSRRPWICFSMPTAFISTGRAPRPASPATPSTSSPGWASTASPPATPT